MRAKIQKWGNSLGLRVPKAFAEQLALQAGSSIDITIERGKLVVRPSEEDSYELATLLDRITPDTIHDEIHTGAPIGREIW